MGSQKKPEKIDQIEFETRALSLVLANSEPPNFKGLTEFGYESFKNKETKEVMAAIMDIGEEGSTLTYSDIKKRLSDDNNILDQVWKYSKTDLSNLGNAGKYRDLLERFESFDSCRQNINQCLKLLNKGESPDRIRDEVLDVLDRNNVESSVPFISNEDIGTLLENELSDIWSGKQVSRPFIETELGSAIDSPLSGGWFYDNVNIIGARPSVGKTALWEKEVLGKGRKGVGSIVVSLEMPPQQHFLRMVNKLMPSPVRINRLYNQNFLQKAEFLLAISQVSELPVVFVDMDRNILSLIAKIRKARQSWPFETEPKMLIIDYIQLLRDDRVYGNRQVEVGSCSSSIMDISNKYGLACLQLAQLNRKQDSEDREPALSDLRESGDLEQNATNVLLLHRKLINDINPGGPQDASIIIAKARHGTPTKVPIVWNGSKTEWVTQEKPKWDDCPF